MGKGRIGETETLLRKRGQEGGGLVKNISGGGGGGGTIIATKF